MEAIKVKDVRRGELVRFTDELGPVLYIREGYDRAEGKYWLQRWSYIAPDAGIFLDGSEKVETNIELTFNPSNNN